MASREGVAVRVAMVATVVAVDLGVRGGCCCWDCLTCL